MLEDLIAYGNLGLITAVEKYDYTLGYRFSTCAVPWIKQAITKGITDNSRTMRIPAHIIQEFNAYKKAVEAIQAEQDGEPTVEQIARKMGNTVEDVKNLQQWKQNSISLSTPLGDSGDDDTIEDLCEDKHDESPVEYAERNERHEKVMQMIRDLKDERTKIIFKLRFGLGEENDPDEYFREHTLEEIGGILTPHLTRERVRQIVNKQLLTWKAQYKDENLF